MAPGSAGTDADSANAMAHTPETAVNMPDTASSAGTIGLPSPSRVGHVLDRSHAPIISVIPETSRAAPPMP